jgi:hypothetical protein
VAPRQIVFAEESMQPDPVLLANDFFGPLVQRLKRLWSCPAYLILEIFFLIGLWTRAF